MIDASPILPNLWQGSAPPTGPALARAGFSVLIRCADEYQPDKREFPGVAVVHAPFDDTEKPTHAELRQANRGARATILSVSRGRKTLVTCMAGRNRSGLVSALALRSLLPCTGREAALLVRLARKNALSNPTFFRILESLPDTKAA